MVRHRWLVLISAILSGCATQTSRTSTTSLRPVDLKGRLQLVDGTPVPGARLTVRCDTTLVQLVRTDDQGRFVVQGLPEGTCHVTGSEARVEQRVRVSRNLIAAADLVVIVPPVRRTVVQHPRRGELVLDETLAAWYERGSTTMTDHRTPRPTASGRCSRPAWAICPGPCARWGGGAARSARRPRRT